MFAAALAALSILTGQFFYAGVMRPVLALPSLVIAATAGLVGWRWLGRLGPGRWPVVALAAWLAWCARLSPDTGVLAGYVRITLGCLLLYLLMANVVVDSRPRLLFLGVLLLGAIAQTGIGVAQIAGVLGKGPQGWYSEQLRLWYGSGAPGRAQGTYLNANHLCWFLNSTGLLALAIAFLGRLRWPLRGFFALGAAVSLAGGVLTLSRSGFLGLGFGMGVLGLAGAWALIRNGWNRRLAGWLLAAVLLPAATLAAIGWQHPAIRARLGVLWHDAYRTELWKVAWQEVEAAPITGGGPGSFTYYSRLWRKGQDRHEDYYVHNDWLQSAAEYGVPGALLLLGVALVHARGGLRRFGKTLRGISHGSNRAALALGGLMAAAFFSVSMGFDFNLQLPANALLAAAVAGMLAPGARMGRGAFSALAGGTLVLFFIANLWGARPELYALRAENRLLKGDLAAAYGEAQHGLSLDIRQPALHRLAGEALMRSARQEREPVAALALYRNAEAAFREAIALSPRDRGHYLRLGETLLALRRGSDALDAARKAIALAPELAQAYELAGQVYEMEGLTDKAMEQYEISLKKTNRSYGGRHLKQLKKTAGRHASGRDHAIHPGEKMRPDEPQAAIIHHSDGRR